MKRRCNIIKRNCNNCKALQKCVSGLGYKCQLGHKIKIAQKYEDIPISYKPLEECPKPITYRDYAEWLSCDRFSNVR